MHDVESLNELDECAECRQQRAQDEEIAPRKRRRREPRQRIEGDEVLRLVPRRELQGLLSAE